MKIKTPLGATPLDKESLQGLIPGLTTQRELNEFEAANITKAALWATKSRKLKTALLTASGLCLLHRKMFDDTWGWAGKFRIRETNIGVAPADIQNQVGILLGDVKYWIDQKTYSLDEIAIRFHYKLVWIHPFANGNGRFSRLVADLVLQHNGGHKFTWGSLSLITDSPKRRQYIDALKMADRNGNISELLKFART